MKIIRFLTGALLLFLLAVPGASAARTVLDAEPPALASSGFEADDLIVLEDEDGAVRPDLRVVVAAPRAAVIGKASSILLVMRQGRTLHVEAGERVRFIAGVREAVWYRGAGVVESRLQLFGAPHGESPVPLGEDGMALAGVAPAIDRGRTRVDVAFDHIGEFDVAAAVQAGVKPRKGKARGDARRAGFLVRVHQPGTLGSISGFVGKATDGTPLRGYPVLALDAASGEPVNAGRSGEDGSFEITRLPPGSYMVVAPSRRGFLREYFNDSPDVAGASPVDVSSGAAAGGVDFLLERP